MVGLPIIEEVIAKDGAVGLAGIAQDGASATPPTISRVSVGDRRFLVYPPAAGFEILPDIEHVSDYAVEPNVFFTPHFSIPALPRLDDKHVRLMVLQDGEREKPLTRFLMPFTVEKPGFAMGPSIVRAWVHPYGPFGVPIIERREAHQIIDDLYSTLAMQQIDLPKILVLPDVPVDSPAVSLLRSVAMGNGLPVASTASVERPVLDATQDSELYFHESLSGHHRRNYNRLWRQLGQRGALQYSIARSPKEVRLALEEFLLLENKGWKGERRTSLASDRFRGAFAREAINNLAERDKCRIHSLTLDGDVVASLVVFIDTNRAWTWKTAYDEDLSAFSPGILLMMRVTETLMDDPNVISADSCALPDHPVMSRLWTEKRAMTTLVIGTQEGVERDVRQVASQLDLYSSTRNFAKSMQQRLRTLMRKRH